MKSMVRWIAVSLCVAIFLGAFVGCSSKKEKVYDPKNDPKLYIDHYEKLIGLVGTERMATLEALGYTLQDVKVDDGNYDYMGLPMQTEYCDVTFDIFVRFDYDEATLRSMNYEKIYAYPGAEEQAIKDILRIGEQMVREFGAPDEVDSWNDWLEEENKVEMDPNPPAYKNEEEIRKLIEMGTGGTICSWDITGFIPQAVREYKAAHFGGETSTMTLDFSADTKYGDNCIRIELQFW